MWIFIGTCFDFGPFRLSWTSWYTIYLYFSAAAAAIVLGRWAVEKIPCSRQHSHTYTRALGSRHSMWGKKRWNNMCKLFLCFRYVVSCSHTEKQEKKCGFGFRDGCSKKTLFECVFICLCSPNREKEIFAAFCKWHLFCLRSTFVCVYAVCVLLAILGLFEIPPDLWELSEWWMVTEYMRFRNKEPLWMNESVISYWKLFIFVDTAYGEPNISDATKYCPSFSSGAKERERWTSVSSNKLRMSRVRLTCYWCDSEAFNF